MQPMPTETKLDFDDAVKLAKEKVAVSRKFIMRNEAFFATLLLSLEVIWAPIGTMGTDGKRLIMDPYFILSISQANVTFIILHEIGHVIYKHGLRRGKRDKTIYNNAGDFAINSMLVRMGMGKANFSDADFQGANKDWLLRMCKQTNRPEYQMPEDGLFDPKYYGISTEKIYDLLIEEQEDQPEDGEGKGEGEGEGEGEGQPGDGTPQPGDFQGDCPWGNFDDTKGDDGKELTQEELAETEREINQAIQNAENVAKGRGQMPACLSEAVGEMRHPSQDWSELLEDAAIEALPTDMSFDRPNRFYIDSDIVMPSQDKEGFGHILIFVDESGSVTKPEHTQFMSDFREICENLMPEQVTMIRFDSRASEPEIVERGDEPEYTRKRGGGTTFRVAFDKAEEHDLLDQADVCIVFTDGGDNSYPDEEPPCPVIWASTGAFWGGNPPWGECIQVTFG